MTRVCQHCHREKPLDDFPFVGRGSNKKRNGPRSAVCRDCAIEIDRVIHNKLTVERKTLKRKRRANQHEQHKGHDAKPPEEGEIAAAEEIAANDVLLWEPTLQDLIRWRKEHPEKTRYGRGVKGSAIQEEHPSDIRFMDEMNQRAGKLVGQERI